MKKYSTKDGHVRTTRSRYFVSLIFAHLCALTVVLLCGCAVGPNYNRPDLAMPKAFTSPSTQPTANITVKWWELFNDPTLNQLEESAMKGSLDLRAAAARVTQARAQARAAGSLLYPEVTFDPSAARSRSAPGRTSINGVSGSSRTGNAFRVPLDLSYEIDLWGRVRRSIEAADATARASELDYQFVLLTLQSDIATNYFFYRFQLDQEQILARTIDAYQKQIDLNQKLVNAKFGSPTDLAQAKVQYQSAVVQQMEAIRQRLNAQHTIAVLMGENPSDFKLDLRSGPTMVPAVPPGLPSELLKRRPDVAESEQSLVAANAQIGVAQAAFYPQIQLTGSAGFESIDIAHTLDWPQRVWSIGSSVTFPLFNAGRLSANLEEARARYEELNANYRKSVLGAIQDVEDTLTDLHVRSNQADAQNDALVAAREYLRLSESQYRQGLISYLQVVDAERTLQSNELQASQILSERLTSTVTLIKALGGGWDAGR